MPRKRMVNPDFFTDPKIVRNFDFAGRLMYQGLWCIAEDSGCFEPDAMDFKLKIFPGDNLELQTIQNYYNKLVEIDRVVEYQANGTTYAWIRNFHKHQYFDRPTAPNIPLPPWVKWHGAEEFGKKDRHKYFYEIIPELIQNNDVSTKCRRLVADQSPLIERNRIEKKGNEEKGKETPVGDNETPPAPPVKSLSVIFEKEFARPLSPLEIEYLISWQDKHPQEIIVEALKRAVAQGKLKLRYIDTILLDWEKNNLRTLLGVLDYEQRYQEKKKKPDGHAPPVEQEPTEQQIKSAADYINYQLKEFKTDHPDGDPSEFLRTLEYPDLLKKRACESLNIVYDRGS